VRPARYARSSLEPSSRDTVGFSEPTHDRYVSRGAWLARASAIASTASGEATPVATTAPSAISHAMRQIRQSAGAAPREVMRGGARRTESMAGAITRTPGLRAARPSMNPPGATHAPSGTLRAASSTLHHTVTANRPAARRVTRGIDMQNHVYLTYQSVGIRSDAPGQQICSSIARSTRAIAGQADAASH
jgi:hypothetical protein